MNFLAPIASTIRCALANESVFPKSFAMQYKALDGKALCCSLVFNRIAHASSKCNAASRKWKHASPQSENPLNNWVTAPSETCCSPVPCAASNARIAL